jgi:hypothetical protein
MQVVAALRRLAPVAAACLLSATLTLAAHTPHTGAASNQTSTTPPSVDAYWLVASDGGIFSFGGASYYGSTGGMKLDKPIVGIAPTPDGGGYWLVASDGGIFTFGDARFFGSTGALKLNKPIVGMAVTPDGGGYWLVASDGGIFSFGDAKFYGSTGNIALNQPIVGMASTPDGGGYWLVASDGGIFSFGDAMFHGSTGNLTLNKPIIGMLAGPSGGGYILVASDGGTFSFGTAPFYGSLGGIPLKNPIVAATATPGDTGYWFSDDTGSVSAFGQASYYGSAPSPLDQPIVGMAEAPGTGAFVGAAYPSGSYGYDVSVFNMNAGCTSGLPSGVHDIGVVQVDGESSGATNPCLAAEAAWAGAGLNLYTFLDNVSSGTALCADTTDCFNVGYNAGLHAFGDAQAAGVNTSVGWWLDVEGTNLYWTSTPADNVATIQGAMAALHNTEGIADVGVYASPGVWNEIVGNYQPSVPYWMADWLSPASGPGTCADVAHQTGMHQLPTGPVEIVQYSDNVNGADGDYAC